MRLSGDIVLYKNTIKKIKKSFGRYLSLAIIIFVGVAFYSGIKISNPSILSLATDYYDSHDLADIKIVSSMGLDDNDVEALNNVDNVKGVYASYSVDVLDNTTDIRVHSITDVNKIELVSGVMPTENSECLADSRNYKLGDVINIDSDSISEHKLTVVGLINSVLYISENYGNSTIGDGTLDSFIFVNKDIFNLDYYTEIYVDVNNAYNAYTKEYNNYISDIIDDISTITNKREEERYDEIIQSAKSELIKANPLLASDEESLRNAVEQLKLVKPVYNVFDRNSAINGYERLNLDAEKVAVLANILPLFFVLIVILMASNTMLRMINEERKELGTLLSLGYSNIKIVNTYLLYVFSATIIGTILGYFVGCYTIPVLVYGAFPYTLPAFKVNLDSSIFIVSMAIGLIAMGFVTIYTCYKDLAQTAANLLRPEPPKNGKTIFLEKIKFIWSKMTFTWKITIRNMFRYKSRVFMTIFGIAGTTALILLGFGIKDSINGLGSIQYNKIFKYKSMIIFNNEVDSVDEDLEKLFSNNNIEDYTLIKQSSIKAYSNEEVMDILLVVPDDIDMFNTYYNLTSSLTKTKVDLKDNQVIITNKIAEYLNVDRGSNITLEMGGLNYNFEVIDIVDNYLYNYVYMSKDVYIDVIKKDLTYNTILSSSTKNEESLVNLINYKNIVSVDYTDDIIKESNNLFKGLDSIIILIIAIAALLSFIVLYNLTSINISERTREVATLKVLGFSDMETNEYIYRESLLLSIIGVLFGLVLGYILHMLVIPLFEGNTSTFIKEIKWYSYIYASLISLTFIIIMQVVTYFELKKIDMIASLKSVE